MATQVKYDAEQVAEMAASPEFYRKAADRVVVAAKGLGGRKVFVADVAAAVGAPVARLAAMLVAWNALGWLELGRCD